MPKPNFLLFILTILLIGSMLLSCVSQAQTQPQALVVHFEEAITPMTVELLSEALSYASEMGVPLILTLNTPGGNLDATFKIVEAIERSSVPVIGYVQPEGAHAWSAGTYILLSSHVAAMAPHTIIGSGQPVTFNPLGGSQPINDTKVLNALTAYLVEKARMHNRNETAAELFITENLNMNAEQAKSQGVIEVVADNMEELLTAVDGITVATAVGDYTLHTRNVVVVDWTPSMRVSTLRTLSDPIIAFFLFSIGIYALILGLTSPGVGGEVVGAALLILGLIGLGITGVNIGALILVGLGAILLVVELFTPGFGLIGGAGFVCMIIGSVLLFPSPWVVNPDWLNILTAVTLAVPLALGGFFIFLAYKVVKARRKPPVLGTMIGGEGEAVDELIPGSTGFIIYQGEYWKARSEETVKPRQRVVITTKEGPILVVRPKEE